MKAKDGLNAEQQVRAMLSRGWLWRDQQSDVLVHPQDYNLFVVYDRAAGTLAYSPALLKALELVILTPAGTNPYYWRDDQRAHAAER